MSEISPTELTQRIGELHQMPSQMAQVVNEIRAVHSLEVDTSFKGGLQFSNIRKELQLNTMILEAILLPLSQDLMGAMSGHMDLYIALDEDTFVSALPELKPQTKQLANASRALSAFYRQLNQNSANLAECTEGCLRVLNEEVVDLEKLKKECQKEMKDKSDESFWASVGLVGTIVGGAALVVVTGGAAAVVAGGAAAATTATGAVALGSVAAVGAGEVAVVASGTIAIAQEVDSSRARASMTAEEKRVEAEMKGNKAMAIAAVARRCKSTLLPMVKMFAQIMANITGFFALISQKTQTLSNAVAIKAMYKVVKLQAQELKNACDCFIAVEPRISSTIRAISHMAACQEELRTFLRSNDPQTSEPLMAILDDADLFHETKSYAVVKSKLK